MPNKADRAKFFDSRGADSRSATAEMSFLAQLRGKSGQFTQNGSSTTCAGVFNYCLPGLRNYAEQRQVKLIRLVRSDEFESGNESGAHGPGVVLPGYRNSRAFASSYLL